MSEDFRITTSFRNSRKRRRLHRLLGDAGIVALVDLWGYCAAERPDGDLSGLSDDDIADEVGWAGEPSALVAGLVEAGFVEGPPGGLFIHGWAERQPWCATSDARRRGAQKAAHARWAARGACKGGTEWCTAQCASHASALPTHAERIADASAGVAQPTVPGPTPQADGQVSGSTPKTKPEEKQTDMRSDAERMRNACVGNAPTPTPTPTPAPAPAHPHPRTDAPAAVEGGGGVRLDDRPDDDHLTISEIEEAVSQAGLGGPVGAGQIAAAFSRLRRPILAWEVRYGIATSLVAKPGCGPGYVRAVIEGARRRGERPPPRALSPAGASQGAGRGPYIGDGEKTAQTAWSGAVRDAGLPVESERIARLALNGEPTDEDLEALRAAGGSWDSYDARGEAARLAARKAMARMGVSIG